MQDNARAGRALANTLELKNGRCVQLIRNRQTPHARA